MTNLDEKIRNPEWSDFLFQYEIDAPQNALSPGICALADQLKIPEGDQIQFGYECEIRARIYFLHRDAFRQVINKKQFERELRRYRKKKIQNFTNLETGTIEGFPSASSDIPAVNYLDSYLNMVVIESLKARELEILLEPETIHISDIFKITQNNEGEITVSRRRIFEIYENETLFRELLDIIFANRPESEFKKNKNIAAWKLALSATRIWENYSELEKRVNKDYPYPNTAYEQFIDRFAELICPSLQTPVRTIIQSAKFKVEQKLDLDRTANDASLLQKAPTLPDRVGKTRLGN